MQNAYQYKYQGQELQETGWYSFKWRNYMPDVGRFFNIDPLAEKYPTWDASVFSGNRFVDARELEGLEPVVLINIEGKMTVDFHAKVIPKSDMTTQNIDDHLSSVSTILSQNSGLQIRMINNPKATFGLDKTKPYQSKKTTFYKDGKAKIEMVLGEARVGNPINQTITYDGTPKVTAHEIAHTLGLEHIWEDPNVSCSTASDSFINQYYKPCY
jgi:RHS repeat-associated protein